jgi:hypothetical protein
VLKGRTVEFLSPELWRWEVHAFPLVIQEQATDGRLKNDHPEFTLIKDTFE